MYIGDKIYVRGTIDEIRKDTIIIHNAGGYFGTVESEVHTANNIIKKSLFAVDSLESEYNAYHTDTDYWRGIRYALDVIEGVEE